MTATAAARTAPGPRGHLILGSLRERRRDPLHFFMSSALQFGGIVRYRMAMMPVHLINEPDAIKYVLQDNQKNYYKGFGFDQLRPLLGTGLLTSEGELWRRQRKLAQPAFHRQSIVNFSKYMTTRSLEALDEWAPLVGTGQPLDMHHEMMRIALSIVGKTLLGVDVAATAKKVSDALDFLNLEVNRRVLSVVDLAAHLPTPRAVKARRQELILSRIVQKIISDKRAEKRPGAPGPARDLLDMFMAARDEETGEGMNDQQLRDEVMTMFLAGHETTANLLAWTWMLLSRNPAVDRKFRHELAEVLGGRTPEFEDLPKLKFTAMLINESLRLYPPAWIVVRQVAENDVILGYKIPKRSIVVLSPYVTHRDPRFWDNPEGFDPERFAVENPSRPKYAFYPFGGGPRQCIGNQFALTEATLVLATIAQKVRPQLVPEHPLVPDPLITLRPRYGVAMTLADAVACG